MQQAYKLPEHLENEITNIVINSTNQVIQTQQFFSKEWFSLAEASKYIGVSHNTFSEFRLMGLKIFEVDGVKRVSKKEIDRFLEQHSY